MHFQFGSRKQYHRHISLSEGFSKGGKPQKDLESLTDGQVEKLLAAIKGLPPYVFVMLGLYAGLRREEILALKWDCVFLDEEAPYLSVRRAWHSEHNRPVISTELKTKAAKRDIPLPDQLTACLKEARLSATSEYVIANCGTHISRISFTLLLIPKRYNIWQAMRTAR